MVILLWNSKEKGRFVPGTGPILPGEGSHLSQGRFLFVPETVPPKMFMFIGFFSCPIMPDIPQSELAATNLCDWGGSLGEEMGGELGERLDKCFLGIFVLHLLCRPTKISPKVLPGYHYDMSLCLVRALVAEISNFGLRKLLALWAPKKSR